MANGLRGTTSLRVRPFENPLFGARTLNPGIRSDAAQIESIAEGIASGTISPSEDELASFVEAHPAAAPFIQNAVGLRRQRQSLGRFFSPGGVETRQQEGPVRPGEALGTYQAEIPQRADFEGATLDALSRGDLSGAKGLLSLRGLGVQDAPASVREFQFFNSLPKDSQNEFLSLKRQGYRVENIGSVPHLVSTIPGVPPIPLSNIEREKSGAAAKASAEGFGRAAGGKAGEVDVEQHEAAKSAADNIAKIDDLLAHLRTSDAITGAGSDMLKNIERVKVFVADSEKAGKKVSDTELLDAMMGSEVFPMIKALGIGARGLDTPAEREFLRSVMTGTTPLNKQTLIRMTAMRRRVAERAIERWNERVDSGELNRFFETTGRRKEKIRMTPRSSRPETVPVGGGNVIDFSDLPSRGQ